MVLPPDEIVFKIISNLRDVDCFQRMHNSLSDIKDLAAGTLRAGIQVSPETMALLNHIVSPELHEGNAHEFFVANMFNWDLRRDANRGWGSHLLPEIIRKMSDATNHHIV